MWNFTRANLKTAIREALGQKAQSLTSENSLVDRAVRQVGAELDLRSMKRRAPLSPSLTDEFDYTAPTNMKGWGIIDLQVVVNRQNRQGSEFILHTPEEFDRLKRIYPNVFTVREFDNNKFLRISKVVSDEELLIHTMDGISDNGTWSTDSDNTAANNLDTSSSTKFLGSAHLVWDVDTTSATTATLQNSTLTAIDISAHKRDGGFIFLKQHVPVTSSAQRALITSFRLQFGTDSNNTYEDTQTTASNGLSFIEGMNVLQFSIPTGDTGLLGTPTDTSIGYVRLEVVLSAAFANREPGWRTDAITARIGDLYQVDYYTDFMWDSGSARVSAADTDTLMAYEQEFDLFVEKGTQLAARAVGDFERAREAKTEYNDLVKTYKLEHPSESKTIESYYHYLGNSTEDGRDTRLNDT